MSSSLLIAKLKYNFKFYSRQTIMNPSWLILFCLGRVYWFREIVLFLTSRPRTTNYDLSQSSFKDLEVEEVVAGLQTDGLYLGINLPEEVTKTIYQYALSAEYWAKESLDVNVSLNGVKPYATAHALNPSHSCREIRKLEKDPKLWAIAARYLKTEPRLIESRLRWIFAGNLQMTEKMKGVFRFHYDLEDYRFIKFFFYLTDVDRTAGPHVCVRGSHKKKKLKYQFSLIRERKDTEIENYYGKENIITICNKAGYGFVEDFYCFHKATPATRKDRLILEIKFGTQHYNIGSNMGYI